MRERTPNRTTILATGALVLGALLLSSLAFAQPPRRGDGELRHQNRARFDDRLVEYLELTDEQQEAWREIRQENRDAISGVMGQLRDNRGAIEEAIEAEDALLIGELTLKGRALQEQAKAAHEALRSDLAAVLTEEQLERWEAFQAANGDGPRFRRKGPRGPRRGFGAGAGA